MWFKENNDIKDLEQKINESIIIEEVPDTEETVIIEQEYEVVEEDPYWDFIKLNLIDVDFSELKKTNKSTKG